MPEEINDGTVFSEFSSHIETEKDDRVLLHEDEEHEDNQFTDTTILIFNESSKL